VKIIQTVESRSISGAKTNSRMRRISFEDSPHSRFGALWVIGDG
jgi:hypothetical protein